VAAIDIIYEKVYTEPTHTTRTLSVPCSVARSGVVCGARSVGLVSRTKFSLSALATAHRHPRRTDEIINFPSRNGRPLVRAFSGAAFDKSFFSKFAVKQKFLGLRS
jgi:hypothetical protein